MAELHVLRVFCGPSGAGGNPLGVFLDGGAVEESRRGAVAAELGFSETVFVEDREEGRLRIFTPEVELPFAGHPTVGAAWLLARTGTPVAALRVPAGELRARAERDAAAIVAPAAWEAPFEYRRLASPAAVEALYPTELAGAGNVYAWAWIDESAGAVRARSFVPEAGIEEDEATGSAALSLCAQVGRAIEVRQGRGSEIRARPLDRGESIEISGRVALTERREL